MSALQKLFVNDPLKSGLSSEVEVAVNEVLREAEDLCRILRSRREKRCAMVALHLPRNDGA